MIVRPQSFVLAMLLVLGLGGVGSADEPSPSTASSAAVAVPAVPPELAGVPGDLKTLAEKSRVRHRALRGQNTRLAGQITAQGAEVQGKLAGLQGSLNQKHEEVTTKLGDINSMLPLWWERALMFFLLSLSLLLGIGHWIWPRRRLTLFERQTIRDTSHMVQETHTLIHELRELIIQPSSSSSNHSPDPRPVLAIILERITGRSDGFQGFDPSTFRPTSFLSDGRILGTVGNPRQHLQWAFALQNADKQIILLGEYPRIMDEKKGVAYQGSPGRPEWIISPMNDWEKHAAAVDSVATTPAAPPN